MKVALSVVMMVVAGALAPPASAAPRKVVRTQQGAVRAELSYQTSQYTNEWTKGRLRIWNGRRLLVDRKVGYGADPGKYGGLKQLWIKQLDGAGAPEVIFTAFSGGNCGCSTTWIYDGQRRVKAPWFWPPAVRDADGDGKPEFHGLQSFQGSWGSRADYAFAAAVWTYANGAVHDVTRSFPAEIQADQAQHYANYQQRLAADNVGGARDSIVAYVYDGYLLGQGDAAMAVLQAAVDAGKLDDPGGAIPTSTFMAQVRDILSKAGFTAASPAPPVDDDGDYAVAFAAAARRHVVRAQQGRVRAELSYQDIGTIPGWEHGRLRIFNGRRLLVDRRIRYGYDPGGSAKQLWIQQLDGTGPPEVVFTLYAGPTCPCFTTWIYEGKHHARAPWSWPVPTVRDADGDGKPEFHGSKFIGGTWGSRADVISAIGIWSYANGFLHDVTRSFPAEMQADQAEQYKLYQDRQNDGNVGGSYNALVNYVYEGYQLGQGDAAMAVVQAEAAAGRLENPDTGTSATEFMTQLRDILSKAGYPPSAMASAAAAKRVIRSQLGRIRAELSYEPGSVWSHSRLRIWKGRKLLVNRPVGVFGPLYGGAHLIEVRQLDGIGDPEVLLTEFSGGNGCCFTNWIYSGAKRIHAPWLEANVLRDADGDGKPEFHVHEERWSLWGARACGHSPVKIWTYANRALQNVTRSFPAEVQADQAAQYASFQDELKGLGAGCARDAMAAYVGDGYALGQGDAAMTVAQAAASAGQLDNDDMNSTGADFLDELRDLLRQDGYTT